MEHSDATREQAEACLAIQDEFMAAGGIMWSPDGDVWPFRFYPEAERDALAGHSNYVDTMVLPVNAYA